MTRATVVLRELTSLLRRGGGSPDERITRALSLLVEQLEMQTAIVSRFHRGRRVITHLAGEPVADASVLSVPAEESICHLVAAGEVGPLVADTRLDPVLRSHEHVEAHSIGAWVGVPLVVGGDIVGTLCAMSPVSRPDLTERDAVLLATVGEYVSEVLEATGGAEAAAPRPATLPLPRAAVDLPAAAAALAAGDDLEGMTRPVLELVHEITGLESAYLTLVDWAGGAQQIKYALNTGGMQIPEGLRVPWEATLCRRSLNEGRPYTRDVPLLWGDSEPARDLGIQTYVSVPLRDADDMVVGTLCATSRDRIEIDDRALHSLRMFAQLLSAQLQREAAHAAVSERAEERELAAASAGGTGPGRDPATGLLSRTGVGAWLRSVVPGLRPGVERLAVGWVDVVPAGGALDTPEDWEERLARAVLGVGRAGDLHGRVGESFVVAAVLPAGEAGLGEWRDRLSYVVATQASAWGLHATLGVEATDDPAADPEGLLQRAAVGARTV